MKKSDSIKIVVIIVALVGAAGLITWQLGLFGGGGAPTVSGGAVSDSTGTGGDTSDPDNVAEGERKVVSDGFTPKNAF